MTVRMSSTTMGAIEKGAMAMPEGEGEVMTADVPSPKQIEWLEGKYYKPCSAGE
jgi:hypothetical protein